MSSMNYKQLFQKLENTLDEVVQAGDELDTLSAILDRLVVDFKDELGITGGRIYVADGDSFVLRIENPETGLHLGFRIPKEYGPVRELLTTGFVLHELGDPEIDRKIEEALGVGMFVAISVGAGKHLLAFSLRDGADLNHVVYNLNTLRHVVQLKLRKAHLEDRLAQARSIQASLLPSTPPDFPGFELWGQTQPAEEVGGDVYDFIEVSSRSLGVAIADSAGHGLPAALQARDALIGLRMGVEERWRITATIEKLNAVISRSGQDSRFISLFYCEIEPNGTVAYTNAGHNPPMLVQDGECLELRIGGLILGPNPEARYERGYCNMAPGSCLLAYTDGIVEAENAEEEMFGTERLRAIVTRERWTNARALVEAIFTEVRRFSATATPKDDQTAVAVLRV